MTAALMMTACSSDDNDTTEAPVAPSTTKTIPYTVTVGGDEATTRATVDSNNKTLRFATGDKLYIWGANIKGVLDITDGIGSTDNATFSGELTYSGSGTPAANLELNATLVSAQQKNGEHINIEKDGYVRFHDGRPFFSSVSDAVQQYSNLTGTSTYGARAFTLTQQAAFLNFEDATSIEAGKPYLVKVAADADLSAEAFAGTIVSKDAVTIPTDYADFIPTLGKTTTEASRRYLIVKIRISKDKTK